MALKNKKGLAFLLTLATVLSIAVGLFCQAGCARQAQALESAVVQYVPPNYYDCIETTIENLLNAYYSHYAVGPAEVLYNGKVFVFKNITVTASSMANATDMWINGAIKCYFLVPGSAKKLKADEKVDVVGIDAGQCDEYIGTLTFEGCIFLPAGSVQLPAGDGSDITVPEY